MASGRSGAPRRVALVAHGAFGVGCECPPFITSFSEERATPNSVELLPVPSPGVPHVGDARLNLNLVAVGYFSGQHIDTFEYHRAEDGEPGTPDDEQRATWPEAHPEFCLEAWCYSLVTYPKADSPEQAKYQAFLESVAAGHARDLAKQGVPRCPATKR